MNIDAVLDGLLQDGQEDWIGLWEISQDVQELLDIDDPMQNLEVTLPISSRGPTKTPRSSPI